MTRTDALLANIRELELRVVALRAEHDKAAFYAAVLGTDGSDTITVELPA